MFLTAKIQSSSNEIGDLKSRGLRVYQNGGYIRIKKIWGGYIENSQ